MVVNYQVLKMVSMKHRKNNILKIMSKTTKINATKNNNTITVNTIDGIKKLFVECGILPKYTDSTHYVGCGTRANVFSVNVLKTQYNVYCDDENFSLFEKFDGIEKTANGNSTDKTRPNTIIVKSTDTLKTMLKMVLEKNSKFALVK